MSRFHRNLNANKGRVSLSVILTVSLLMGAFALQMSTSADAAALTSISDVLSSSAPGATSTHVISFTMDAGTQFTSGEAITLTFDTGFNLTGLSNADPDDYDITVAATEEAVVAAGCGGTDEIEITSIVGQVITFTACGGYTAEAAGSAIVIEIGDNATAGNPGDTNISNPGKSAPEGTADTPTIDIGGDFGDTGTAIVAIIEGVTVSVTIDQTLSFTIAGTAPGGCTGDTGTVNTVSTTTATTVPYGTAGTANEFYVGCQVLTVNTNASGGYDLTGEVDQALENASNDLIDNASCDSTCTNSSTTAWAVATNNGFGYSCVDTSGTDCATSGVVGQYLRFACTGLDAECDPGTGSEAPQTVMSNAGAVNNSQGTIHYKMSFSGTQPAGTYTNTVTYIATPTF